MKFLMIGLALLISAGCASNPHKAKKIDTSIEKDAKISGDSKIGVKDGNMIYQKKVNMAEELRRLQYDVYELEDKVYGSRKFGSQGMYGNLKQCRLDLTLPENGGSGKLRWTEPIDRVTDKEEDFEIGLDDKDQITGVSEEFLKDRIDRFKGYKKVLVKREDEYREKIEICQAELRSQKHKHSSQEQAAKEN